jgi:hypothetical protein
MEDAIACLRQGAVESRGAALVLIEDSVDAVGSLAVLGKVCHLRQSRKRHVNCLGLSWTQDRRS